MFGCGDSVIFRYTFYEPLLITNVSRPLNRWHTVHYLSQVYIVGSSRLNSTPMPHRCRSSSPRQHIRQPLPRILFFMISLLQNLLVIINIHMNRHPHSVCISLQLPTVLPFKILLLHLLILYQLHLISMARCTSLLRIIQTKEVLWHFFALLEAHDAVLGEREHRDVVGWIEDWFDVDQFAVVFGSTSHLRAGEESTVVMMD